MKFYREDTRTALSAKEEAQRLAFAPIAFQASKSLRDLGILAALGNAPDSAASAKELAQRCGVTEYGVAVLLDMGLSAGLVIWQNDKYQLTKLGQFVDFDPMTIANMDFVADICYQGMGELTEAIKHTKPAGLKHLGEWDTLYQGLSQLNQREKDSWFGFDHYYSDRSFPTLLTEVFAQDTATLCDIGANTGKWTKQCCQHNNDVHVTMVDLPQQLAVANENMAQAGFTERVTPFTCDLLAPKNPLPAGQDVYWMSQFLDCFSKEEIVSILVRVKEAMKPQSRIFILELFPDCQDYESASYSLNATSLYFTAIANGNSRFYMSHEFLPLIELAGLSIVKQTHNIGLGHSLIECGL
ncbi:methyltransferase [Shewanella intestini]|uniref:Methyltransferase domain-containing protein n=1 Tax=Shewanella intestini TaxID=2017544 RepID=A0ABS5I2R3_9GAMM|nr:MULTISPECIES: class I SAM-dependent methyltransferase [Shewanella]MBR9728310.1 methyltransferase domain-containing protein [Shewanella intestini]MRG35775.1 methyltransferase domain-containing protein [Shewanella sp. XMDDZSB0408]